MQQISPSTYVGFRFNEVWRGRESFSDQKARMEAIESLKKMIRSWLDDTFPEMPEAERIALSEAMDVTMVEKVKEQSMRTFFEINNVIRMSFIEMQYMKKVSMLKWHRCVSYIYCLPHLLTLLLPNALHLRRK